MAYSKQSCSKFTCRLFFVLAVLLIIIALVVPKQQGVLWINQHHFTWLDQLMVLVTTLGAGLLFVPLLVVMLFVRFRYAILTASVLVGHGFLCAVLKHGLFGHLKRPKELIDNSLLHFVPGVEVHSHFSFPSGHTATIFCFAFLLSLFVRNTMATIGLLLIALAVGYSRVYLLQHFLVDVAAGAVIGVVTTYLLWRYFETSQFPSWMNNRLEINLQTQTVRVTDL
jgi:membrane-associated phospholipid phosphatase